MNQSFLSSLSSLGFHIDKDLVPYHSMISDLKRSDISKKAKQRLKWMDHYHKYKNVSLTCRYFGISRKTFYAWKERYNPYNLKSLEERSRKPLNTRKWEVSRREELNIITLRKKYIRYGKEKLKVLYLQIYKEEISSWKIQRVIEKHNLYYKPDRTIKMRKKRKRNQSKKRITEIKKEERTGFLIALDTVTIYWNGIKRHILTGIDIHSKIAFARMYSSKHSRNTADFLKRIYFLLEGKIDNILTDNGTEFEKDFGVAIESLGLNRYYSRPRTPKDNAVDERFNRTLKEEFIQLGNFTPNLTKFNEKLTEWLIEYNFHRPHQSLGYKTPIDFQNLSCKVLPMYPSSTWY